MSPDDHKQCRWPYDIYPSTWDPYDDTKDYCGPENSTLGKYLSRYIQGVDCNKAYWAHDMRYSLGTTKEDKVFADKQMHRDQKLAIRKAYKWWHPGLVRALWQSYWRYKAVLWFGKEAFENAGNKSS